MVKLRYQEILHHGKEADSQSGVSGKMTVEMEWSKFFKNTISVVDICHEKKRYVWIKVFDRLQPQLMYDPALIGLNV